MLIAPLLGVICSSVFVAVLLNLLQTKLESTVVQATDERRLQDCKMHSWAEVVLLSPKELRRIKQSGLDLAEFGTQYCTKCGYLPGRMAMLSSKALVTVNLQRVVKEQLAQRVKDVDKLKSDFLEDLFACSSYSAQEKDFIKVGYLHYDRFVSLLPTLIEQLEFKRFSALIAEKDTPNA